jgi:uncharacterized repeat protein (TIGR01451 family)
VSPRLLVGNVVILALITAGVSVASGPGESNGGKGGVNRPHVAVVPDAASVTAFEDIGFTITVSNPAPRPAKDVELLDSLPAAGNLSWTLDSQSEISGCKVIGEVYAQSVSCPSVTLEPDASFAVHVMSHTTTSTEAVVVNTATVTTSNWGTATTRGEIAHGSTRNGCLDTPIDTTRTLAFDDEFDSETVDLTKWTRDSLPFGGQSGSTHKHNTQYGSYILSENTVVKDGVLSLIANDEPVTEPDVPSLGTIPYSEGMIHTKDKFSRLGGYFEMCAKVPQGRGMWPAFWLAAQNGQWPPEMDIMEWFGSIEALQVGQPFATGANAGSQWQGTWIYSAEYTKGYHTYGLWWKQTAPATIRYYLDGQMVKEVSGTTSNLISNTPMYMILNSGTWAPATRGGPPDATTVFPNSMDVDWVRVYTAPPPQPRYSAP